MDLANADLHGDQGGPCWSGEQENDLRNLPVGHQEFCQVPFDVIDPVVNERRGALALSCERAELDEQVAVPLDGATAGSIYFLHAASNTGEVAGEYVIRYVDGGSETVYLRMGKEICGWWEPHDTALARLAWWGPNPAFSNVGVVAYGWDNPHPDRQIEGIELREPRTGGTLLVVAMTLSDAPVWFERPITSYGIPDNWGAAAVVYALIEGLAGVVDRGVAYDEALVAPRWPAADRRAAAVAVAYAESGGYVAYRYRHDPEQKRIELELAGSGDRLHCHVLLPQGTERAEAVTCDGGAVPFEDVRVEGSAYADFALDGGPARRVAVTYA
jgi:hypothetical protein